jgi:heparan-alpha-glucosaminide N-acetyltransferase
MNDGYDLDPTAEPSPRPEPVRIVMPKPTTGPEPELASAGTRAAGPGDPVRLVSLDAFRGFIMLAMASSGLGIAAVAKSFPDSRVWTFLASQTDHVEWRGCSFWDLIQPSFMFIVGVAMPWAYANRRAKGQGWFRQFGHALGRSLILIALGVFLSSNSSKQTNWTFVNVLTQIGLGYAFVFLVLKWSWPWQLLAAIAVLVGYWAYFAFWPMPETSGTWPVTPDYATLANHWDKNVNAASDFDAKFLNMLPYPDGVGFKGNEGGYATLNFIPSIATAIFGVLVGRLLMSGTTPKRKIVTLLVAAALGLAIGTALDYFTICPVVKRIWTPSWVLVSTGWTCLFMAAFYLVVDVWRQRWLALPLVVVGANSIVMYVMSQLMRPWVRQTLRTHMTTVTYVCDQWLGFGPSYVPRIKANGGIFEGTYGPIYDQAAVLLVFWLICAWLYRRKLFVRI